jgi:hypothetical protein
MKKEVIKRMVRLAKGVAVAGRVVRVLPVDREIFEGDLRLVRKITCAYYPSACRHFGAARGYSAAQVGRQ